MNRKASFKTNSIVGCGVPVIKHSANVNTKILIDIQEKYVILALHIC